MDSDSLKAVQKAHEYAEDFIQLSHATAVCANSYMRAALATHKHGLEGTREALEEMRVALVECDINEKRVVAIFEKLHQNGRL